MYDEHAMPMPLPSGSLRCSMSSLWPARRFVGKDTHAIEFIPRHFIGDRLQRAGVERAGDAVTSVCTSVEKRFEVHRGNGAIFLHTGLHVHQHRVATAM